jgi:beta-phosphoglucomutase-like phosphatase (HAD superfamily)
MDGTMVDLFDMDGTMVDSMPAHAAAGTSSRSARHRHAGRRDPAPHHRPHRRRVHPRAVRRRRADDRALELIAEKEAIYREPSPRSSARSPASPLRAQAQDRGLKIAVATAGDKHNIAFVLRT